MNKSNDERKISFSNMVFFPSSKCFIYNLGRKRQAYGLALLHVTVRYLEGGLFFDARVDDNMSFPRYSQIGNGQEQRTLTRWP